MKVGLVLFLRNLDYRQINETTNEPTDQQTSEYENCMGNN